MWDSLLIIAVCFLIFERASNYLVEGLGAISHKFKISEAVMGASIAAIGSSAPEFGSSAFSVIEGHPTIGLGTIIGSAIFNVTVIVGAGAFFGKYAIERRVFYRDGLFYLFTVLIAIAFVWDGSLARFEATLWALVFFGYLAWLIFDARRGKPVPRTSLANLSPRRAFIYVIIGLLAIIIAARYLVIQVADISSSLGISEATFSLVIVAIGTSIPDLFTSVQGARMGMGSLAVSNALGSNIFDILACLGIPFSFSRKPTPIEGPLSISFVALLASVVLVLAVLRNDWSVSKIEAVLLFGVYGVYLGLILI
ncbi:hypothetical protein AKJ58_00860 [candidate division MSBL1 archaeon SCGC-AAA385D11]|uniref:Sodium/calcium exchanger membrane region domain-containing protein n=1 Tax=candidate division MSBL1 archaeon SCGC-AAA385D11 TaxID=1698286 RepID=A0A133VNT7_9EURY|nr:hypothetical protein AKJ58_00860 [candidate division MSBL1 archaeon SCGC-AAA385D11]